LLEKMTHGWDFFKARTKLVFEANQKAAPSKPNALEGGGIRPLNQGEGGLIEEELLVAWAKSRDGSLAPRKTLTVLLKFRKKRTNGVNS